MSLFQTLAHLLPNGAAWRLTQATKTLRLYIGGLSASPADIRDFADGVYDDRLPARTRELTAWEDQFGISAAADTATRRANLSAAWQATGGQSPRYLQDVVQAAGFSVYVHEWWVPGSSPRTVRDPRSYTRAATIGSEQCSTFADQPECSALPDQPECNAFLANDPGYLVNLNLTATVPPPVPSDPTKWPYFLYWCGATFGTPADVPAARRAEFERLLLKLCPAQQWLVTIINYV